jgi:hypothetical protein
VVQIETLCPSGPKPSISIGHLGLGGVGDSKGLLEAEFRHRHIKWHTNAKVDKVEADKVTMAQQVSVIVAIIFTLMKKLLSIMQG